MESLRLFENKILLEEIGMLEFADEFFILRLVKISDTQLFIISYSPASFARSRVASFPSIEFMAKKSRRTARSGEAPDRAKKWPSLEGCFRP
jgi:hypothetical protein